MIFAQASLALSSLRASSLQAATVESMVCLELGLGISPDGTADTEWKRLKPTNLSAPLECCDQRCPALAWLSLFGMVGLGDARLPARGLRGDFVAECWPWSPPMLRLYIVVTLCGGGQARRGRCRRWVPDPPESSGQAGKGAWRGVEISLSYGYMSGLAAEMVTNKVGGYGPSLTEWLCCCVHSIGTVGRADEVSFCPPRSWNSQDEEEWVSMPRTGTGTRRARRAGETKGVFEEAKVELLGGLEWWMVPGG